MKKSEYIYYQTQLEEMEMRRQDLLIDMELHHDREDAETFEQWWYGEGHFRTYRQLTEDIESLKWRLEAAIIEEEETIRILKPGGDYGREE